LVKLEISAAAAEDLDRLIATHSLPDDTKERFRRSVEPLERFPLLGPALRGRWSEFRFVLGPWRWMIVVYVHSPEEDRVVIVTVQDGRSSTSATASDD
jgi:plasmid stabilization system protein ParE